MIVRLVLVVCVVACGSPARAQDCAQAALAIQPAEEDADESDDAEWTTTCAVVGDAAVAVGLNPDVLGARVRVIVMRAGSIVGRSELPVSVLAPDASLSFPPGGAPTVTAADATTALIQLRLARPRRTLSWRLGVADGLTWVASWVGARAPTAAVPRRLPSLSQWPELEAWPESEFPPIDQLYDGELLEAVRTAAEAYRAFFMASAPDEMLARLTRDAVWIRGRDATPGPLDVRQSRAVIERQAREQEENPPDGAGFVRIDTSVESGVIVVRTRAVIPSFMGEEATVEGADFRLRREGGAMRIAEIRTWPISYGYHEESESYDARHWRSRDAAVTRARARVASSQGSVTARRALRAALWDARHYMEALEVARAICAGQPTPDDLRALVQLARWLGYEDEATAAEGRIAAAE